MRLVRPPKNRKEEVLFCLFSEYYAVPLNYAAARNKFAGMLRGFVVIVTAVVCLAGAAYAATSITARYLQGQGEHIIWEIRVSSPPPAAVIVTQYLLPGTEILESSHPLSSFDKERGTAKWLMTDIATGTLKMEMTVSKPIRRRGEIHGEVMYEDESRNTTVSIFIMPGEP
jgi:hypothetical protein